MNRQAGLLMAFGWSVLLFETLRTALAWWQGELTELGWQEYALFAALPLSLVVVWRANRRPPRRRADSC